MFKTLQNAWKIPELRKKIIFTLFILLLCRIGNAVPAPFINHEMLKLTFEQDLSNTIFGVFNTMTGSAFSQATVFALGIQPYIQSSIIIQLLTVAIPPLERLAKEGGEEGKKKIAKITRWTTVGLGLLMSWGMYMTLRAGYGTQIIAATNFWEGAVIVLTLSAGSAVVMWMGEQITEFGIGNGISMILFANIISDLPRLIGGIFSMVWWNTLIVLAVLVALILLIVFINDAERRIPIQYAKRVVGRKVYGGQNTNLPIKVAMSGVMPIIFAETICSLPGTVCTFIPGGTNSWFYLNMAARDTWFYAACYFVMIFFFSWFYSTIQYDPVEIGNNLKKNGGFIPGFRPGRPTSDFIQKVINKIIIFGSVYLGIVALLPLVGGKLMPAAAGLAIGGTSIIIIVGVALETVKALEAQMLMRHYKGFLD